MIEGARQHRDVPSAIASRAWHDEPISAGFASRPRDGEAGQVGGIRRPLPSQLLERHAQRIPGCPWAKVENAQVDVEGADHALLRLRIDAVRGRPPPFRPHRFAVERRIQRPGIAGPVESTGVRRRLNGREASRDASCRLAIGAGSKRLDEVSRPGGGAGGGAQVGSPPAYAAAAPRARSTRPAASSSIGRRPPRYALAAVNHCRCAWVEIPGPSTARMDARSSRRPRYARRRGVTPARQRSTVRGCAPVARATTGTGSLRITVETAMAMSRC
jgi:hypothetical protein